jgi:hypothetical protein
MDCIFCDIIAGKKLGSPPLDIILEREELIRSSIEDKL